MPWNVWHTVNFMLLIIWGFLEVFLRDLVQRCVAQQMPRRRDGIFSCHFFVVMVAHRLCRLTGWDVSICLENPFPFIISPCAVGTGCAYFGREIASGRRVSRRGRAERIRRWFNSPPVRTGAQQLFAFPMKRALRGDPPLCSAFIPRSFWHPGGPVLSARMVQSFWRAFFFFF